MERLIYPPQGEFKPAKTVEVTQEGSEAALIELVKRAETEPGLRFIEELKGRHADSRVFLVGGVVRDAILGLKSDDYDLLIEGISPDELESFMASRGRIIESSGTSTGTYKFLPHNQKEAVDIGLPRIEKYESLSRKPNVETTDISVEEDLARRDFTFNAVAMEIFSKSETHCLDYFGGIEDIRNRIIRSVGNPNEKFSEDPLRILRAVRFACKLDFAIDKTLLIAMKEFGKSIDQTYLNEEDVEKRRVAFERIKKEIEKSMESHAEKFIEILDQIELLPLVFPDVDQLKGVEQPKTFHSEGDAFVHTKLVLQNIPDSAPLRVKLAGLYHDTGKLDTSEINEDDNEKITFYGHDKFSAEKARKALKRLRFSNNVINDVIWLIDNHMRIFSFTHMKPAKQKIMASNPLFKDLLILALADDKSSMGRDKEKDFSFFSEVDRMVGEQVKSPEGINYIYIISGRDIIDEINNLGIGYSDKKHGKIVGKIKKLINNSYNNGKINNKDEAVLTARELIKQELKI